MRLQKLVADVHASGGSEMPNYQLFVERLTGALGLPQPEFAREQTRFNDYVFERNVTFRHPNGTSSTGRIDCYKRDSFILEAKQSAKRQQSLETEQLVMAGLETAQKQGHAKRGIKSWDKVMIAARRQAEDYARALPVDHGYPPFLLIVDVGNVIEVYADFSGLELDVPRKRTFVHHARSRLLASRTAALGGGKCEGNQAPAGV